MSITETDRSFTNGVLAQKADELLRQTEALRKERADTMGAIAPTLSPLIERLDHLCERQKILDARQEELVAQIGALAAVFRSLGEAWKELTRQQLDLAAAQRRQIQELEKRLPPSRKASASGLL